MWPRCGGLLVRDLWLTFTHRVAVDDRSLAPATTVSDIELEAACPMSLHSLSEKSRGDISY